MPFPDKTAPRGAQTTRGGAVAGRRGAGCTRVRPRRAPPRPRPLRPTSTSDAHSRAPGQTDTQPAPGREDWDPEPRPEPDLPPSPRPGTQAFRRGTRHPPLRCSSGTTGAGNHGGPPAARATWGRAKGPRALLLGSRSGTPRPVRSRPGTGWVSSSGQCRRVPASGPRRPGIGSFGPARAARDVRSWGSCETHQSRR